MTFDSKLYHRQYYRNYTKEQREKINARRRILRTSKKGKAAALYEKIRFKQKDTDISLTWIKERVEIGVCELTGIAFTYDRHGNRAHKAPSIDRIDSSKGLL